MIVNSERRRKSFILARSVISAFVLILLIKAPLFCQQPKSLKLFVSTRGDDKNPGTEKKPFKSLVAARDHIRKLKSFKGLSTTAISVVMRGGEYLLPEGIEFGTEDSGTPQAKITYCAADGEKVSLTAGIKVDQALLKPLNTSAYSRLHPKADPSKIFEIDLSSLNLRNASRFAPSNCFSDSWHIIDLFINDKRQPLSQWPNPTENIRNSNDAGWVTCNGSRDSKAFFYGSGGKPEDKDSVNELDLDGTNRSSRWATSLGRGHEIWLKGFWRVPWEPFTIKTSKVDTANHSITLTEEPDGGMGSKYSAVVSEEPVWRTGLGKEKWKAINLLEEIDYAGEWALDVKDQKIYFYSPAPLQDLSIMIADLDKPVISVEDAEWMIFSRLNVNGSLANGISVINSRGVTIASCMISNVGGDGILLKGGRSNRIQSNDISETGGAGILVANAGERKSLIPSGVVINNNHIHHVGNLAFKEAIQLANSVGIEVSHNLMHDMPKSAVRTDMVNDCLFEYNEVHNIALGESDNGAFYNYGGWGTYGNVFRFNFVHHINRSNGFYCDDGDSGDIFYNNIVYDAIDAIKFGGGHHNIAKNNLFIRCKDQGIDDRGIARNYRPGSPYEERLLEMKPDQEPWKSYGKKLKALYGFKADLWSDIFRPTWHPEYPNGSEMIDNVSVECGPYLRPKHGDVTISGNLEITDMGKAGFFSLDNLDLRTRNADILKKIPDLNSILPKTGVQKDQYREVVPSRVSTGGLRNRGAAGNAWDEDQLIK